MRCRGGWAAYLGIYFYLRVIQFMFMSPDAGAEAAEKAQRFALAAGTACLAATGVVAVVPGWVIGLF